MGCSQRPAQDRGRTPGGVIQSSHAAWIRPPSKCFSRARLGMAAHALDGREFLAKRAFDVVDALMHVAHGELRVNAAMEVDNLAVRGLAHAHVVDLPDKCNRSEEHTSD